MSKVLFSPVGGTDPMSNANKHDGAILHIMRNYRPHRIVLFFSQEMLVMHRGDNRYLKSIELLYRELTKDGKSYFLKDDDETGIGILPTNREEQNKNKTKERQEPESINQLEILPDFSKETKVFPADNAVLKYYKIGDLQVEVIEREGLSEVQDFNTFYKEFPKWINYVMKDISEEDLLLLNVSSGTPAMKGCLLSMQLLQDIRCKVIQVSTPVRSINQTQYIEFKAETEWDHNRDNDVKKYVNRCTEVSVPDYACMIQETQIKRLLLEYDYKGAFSLAKSLPKEHSKSYLPLMKMALQRSQLNMKPVENFIKRNKGVFNFPVKKDETKEAKKASFVFEYCLQMQLKLFRGDLDGFIRSITPVVWDLFFQIIENDLGLPISRYIQNLNNDNKAKIWDWDLLQKEETEMSKKIFDTLDNAIFSQNYSANMKVYSPHLLAFIKAHHPSDQIISTAEDLRFVEERIRNLVAHQMVPVTEDSIKSKTNFSPKEIMDKVKILYNVAYQECGEEKWKSYERMNESILELLSRKG
jgi:CRISPR-associated protein, csm6 family